jgi:hypothetical protein
VAALAKLVADRRRRNKHSESCKHVARRSIDWKLVEYVSKPQHARFDFTLEGCVDDEGMDSHNNLPHCSPSDSILERALSTKRVFINPPWQLAEQVGRHFECGRRTTPTSTMVVFVLPQWAKFNELTKNSAKNSQRGHNYLLASGCIIRPIRRWLLKLLGDANCAFYDQAPTATSMNPPRYVYLLTTRKSPSLPYNNFPRKPPPY